MKKTDLKNVLIRNLPYLTFGILATNVGQAWRMAEGWDTAEKLQSFFNALPEAFSDFLPGLYPIDLLIGFLSAGFLKLIIYLKKMDEKKFRKNIEYGSARWGNAKDIEPFKDPEFKNNVILTATEYLTMNSRPKNPAYARNKNVLVIGGSGSGKTRFWLKPNLLQMHSSYVITDPKGTQYGILNAERHV